MMLWKVTFLDSQKKPDCIIFDSYSLAQEYAAIRQECAYKGEIVEVKPQVLFDDRFWKPKPKQEQN
jgi:spore coat polysaccharide biosynthesis predicted glycosyltransferase SpsG